MDKLAKIKKLADAMYYAAQYLTTDASMLHKAMYEYHNFIIYECKEEPVSDEFEEQVKALWKEVNTGHNYSIIGSYNIFYWLCLDIANWQKEQMMKDATEAYIRRNKYTKKKVLNGFDVTCDAVQKFNGGDKVKVIVIKED